MGKWTQRLRTATDYKTIAMVALLLIVVLIFYIVMHSLRQRDDAINAAKAKDAQISSLTDDVNGLTHQVGVLANQLRKHGIKPRIIVKKKTSTSSTQTTVAPPPSQPSAQPAPSPTPTHHPASHSPPPPEPSHSPHPTPTPTHTPPPPHKICVPFTKVCIGKMIIGVVWW